jgi:dTDP-4-amino-4,6-dideoxygalactose transaminase
MNTSRRIDSKTGRGRHAEAVEPAGRWTVPLSDIVVDEALLDAVREAVDSGWWSMGPRVEAFERGFAELTGSRHAFAVANGTAALHLALIAAGCGPGDEVILPSLNFVAAANTIVHAGAVPVFCDIRGAGDLNLDPADVEAAITPATKALLVLHYGGHPCAMGQVLDLAEQYGLAVIEDAAHAPGALWRGRPCGAIGAVGCFSFFSNKNLPIGEGGMVVTDDDQLAAKLRLLRSHGMTSLTWDRHRGHASSYDVADAGFNFRLDEIRAAMGLAQLSRLPLENERRAQHVRRYRDRLAGRNGITVPFEPAPDDQPSPDGTTAAEHILVAVLPEGAGSDAIRTALREQRIQTSMHYPPIHRFSFYASRNDRRLPVTDAIAARLITLPLYGHMEAEQVDLVADALLEAVTRF